MAIGDRFYTSNSYVSGLAVGTTLTVEGNGYLRVASVPKPVFKPGDRVRIVSKGRVGVIVRMTTRDGLSEQLPEPGEQLYVADGTSVVRVAQESDLRKL